jgi:hypothetical protein
VTLDNDDSDDAGARDKAEGASGDVDTRCIEQDASLHDTFAILELAFTSTESIDASGPWYVVEEPTPGLRSCERHDVPSAPAQAQSQTLPQPSKPLQDQTNQQSIDDITQSTSVESVLHFIPNSSDSGDDGWTDESMAELEKELGLVLGEQQVESLLAGTPTSLSPRSVEAPQDEIQSQERSETTGGRQEELRDASRRGSPAQDLEWWEQRETQVVVEEGAVAMQQQEELGQPAVGDQQDLVEVDDVDDPEDKEATEALPAAQPKTPEMDELRFRLRGVRARQLAGRQTRTTQYRVIWGEYPNRSDSWFNEDDVQISMPCEPHSQDLALQVDIFRVCGMRSSLRKGRKVFEYLVDMFGLDSRTWTTEDQLRISLSPMLVAELKGN